MLSVLCTSCMGHTFIYLLYVTTLSACVECIVYELYGSHVCLLTVCDHIECIVYKLYVLHICLLTLYAVYSSSTPYTVYSSSTLYTVYSI